MDYHLRTRHSSFAIPGWPALAGTHGATADTPGRRLPSDMTELLRLHDDEEDRLGLAASTPWDAVGIAEPAAAPVNASLSTTRRDATARLHADGEKRKATDSSGTEPTQKRAR
jgi:hypothetical protein